MTQILSNLIEKEEEKSRISQGYESTLEQSLASSVNLENEKKQIRDSIDSSFLSDLSMSGLLSLETFEKASMPKSHKKTQNYYGYEAYDGSQPAQSEIQESTMKTGFDLTLKPLNNINLSKNDTQGSAAKVAGSSSKGVVKRRVKKTGKSKSKSASKSAGNSRKGEETDLDLGTDTESPSSSKTLDKSGKIVKKKKKSSKRRRLRKENQDLLPNRSLNLNRKLRPQSQSQKPKPRSQNQKSKVNLNLHRKQANQ